MPSLLRFAQLALIAVASMAFSGCATSGSSAGAKSAVPVAWVDGKHVVLSPTEIARIRPSLAPLMEKRGLSLVTDLASADYLLTIRYEPNAADTENTTIHVVSLSENRLRSLRAMGMSSMDNSVDASRPAAAGFPGGIGTSDPSRNR
jgi:hypothetical protein